MTNDKIKILALSCGFTERPQENGEMDLNPYVYEFAKEIFEKAYRAGQEDYEFELKQAMKHDFYKWLRGG